MVRLLHQLARQYGVQTAYYDVSHLRRQAEPEALLAVLRSLGVPVQSLSDVPSAWRERQNMVWRQVLEPVLVAWEGRLPPVEVRLPRDTRAIACELRLESGESRRCQWQWADLPVIDAEAGRAGYVLKRLALADSLPVGYHRLRLDTGEHSGEALIIAAPLKAYSPEDKDPMWGVFLPLYSLHTTESRGSGTFSDFAALADWVARSGGDIVAALPLLAAFLSEPFEPSPYAPVSRLFWNEFYLDLNAIPEIKRYSPPSMSSVLFAREMEELRRAQLVDYRREMALKRGIIEELCRFLYGEGAERLDRMQRYARENPEIEQYARFRAAVEKQGVLWRQWPARMRDGDLSAGDYDEDARRYHLYAQWLACQQVDALTARAREKGVHIYLDLPLGVHPGGYDPWRWQDIFVNGVSAGAPPDAVFTWGQNWSVTPLHPENLRKQGYRYVIDYLRNHFRHTGIIRIDHVMGLHRLFWIPEDMGAEHGVYVRYRAEELYAILSLESHRNQTMLVGEDLGTVPPEVRPAMASHRLHRMYVLHYELQASPRAVRPVPAGAVASLNTHDMPPFAAFWQGLDIEKRREMGLLDRAAARREKQVLQEVKRAVTRFLRGRSWFHGTGSDTRAVLEACLGHLSASPARAVLVNLEDLWLETEPQNVPGTGERYPSWRRRARHSLEQLCCIPEVAGTLGMVDSVRRKSRQKRKNTGRGVQIVSAGK